MEQLEPVSSGIPESWMTMKRKHKSVDERLAGLKADPEYRARVEKAHVQQKREEEALKIAEAPVIADLRARAGVAVQSVWELVNRSDLPRAAISILVEHLHREYPKKVREGIARALAVTMNR
jgi:hypothetical protein